MDSEELLAQLADIHLPQPVGYWPPAPGWWVLALLLLVLAFFAARKYFRYSHLRHVCNHALAELDRCYARLATAGSDNADSSRLRYINEVNTVLRRVALVHFPQAVSASLDGTAWVDFIRQKGESSAMTDEIAAALSFGRFQKQCDVDVDALHNFGRHWISSLYLQKPTPDMKQGMSH
jgi:hypothetical protein